MPNKPAIDMDYVTDRLVRLLTTPSPTGFTNAVMNFLEGQFRALGLAPRRTFKGALLVTIPGRDDERQRLLSGHVDTLGAVVKEIKSSGRLRYSALGGVSGNSVEGEYCTIFTDAEATYTGTILTTKASAHVYGEETRKQERTEENMEIRLDVKVRSAEAVRALGIEVGDFVAFDPRTEVTPGGFIKSRHLDDKAGVAAILGAAKCLVDHKLTPTATTHLFISNFEEVGHGAAGGLPEKVREFIAVDMGVVGEGVQADEYCVSIAAKDSSGPYDRELKKRLVALARANGIPYAVDVYPHYGSDASAALRAGAEIRAIVIGPGVDASHAFERTHREGLQATADLLVAYLMS